MRESIGGAFLIKIMVVFIVLYNSLLAIAVNYAMAFRVKNTIINIIEQHEGCKGAIDEITKYTNSVGYYKGGTPKIIPTKVDNRGYYYTVTTFLQFDFPIVKDILRVEITGETKTIYDVEGNNTHCSE